MGVLAGGVNSVFSLVLGGAWCSALVRFCVGCWLLFAVFCVPEGTDRVALNRL